MPRRAQSVLIFCFLLKGSWHQYKWIHHFLGTKIKMTQCNVCGCCSLIICWAVDHRGPDTSRYPQGAFHRTVRRRRASWILSLANLLQIKISLISSTALFSFCGIAPKAALTNSKTHEVWRKQVGQLIVIFLWEKKCSKLASCRWFERSSCEANPMIKLTFELWTQWQTPAKQKPGLGNLPRFRFCF